MNFKLNFGSAFVVRSSYEGSTSRLHEHVFRLSAEHRYGNLLSNKFYKSHFRTLSQIVACSIAAICSMSCSM